MASPYFLGVDLSIPTYTWSAGVNTSYPVSNLATYIVADVSKSNATTANQYITIDFGSAVACNTLVLAGINFTGIADTSVYLQTNSNDDTTWTDASDVVEITQGSVTQVKTFNSQTKRYWRIIFNSSAPLSAAPQIGNLFLGTRLTFDSTYEWDFAKENKSYRTTESESIDGTIRTSQSFAGRKRWDLVFRLQSNTWKTSWNTFIDTVRGKLRPFYFIDADGTTINYVHLENDYTEVKNFRYNLNNVRIQLKEQIVS